LLPWLEAAGSDLIEHRVGREDGLAVLTRECHAQDRVFHRLNKACPRLEDHLHALRQDVLPAPLGVLDPRIDDLRGAVSPPRRALPAGAPLALRELDVAPLVCTDHVLRDRKSTRLNSSHVKISYAVFCL